MINFTKEGRAYKTGLNIYIATGGFVLVWVWYCPVDYTLSRARFRLRLHIKPRILWSVDRVNVVRSYLDTNDLIVVNKEILEDLHAIEDAQKRTNEPYATIKPI
jgi:hypothetical protein